MFYVLLIIIVILVCLCVGTGLYARNRDRHLREKLALAQRLTSIVGDMNRILLQAEQKDDFTLRCHNDCLLPCWEIHQCNNPDCATFANPDLRCWHSTRPACRISGDFRELFERTKDCEACAVYKKARPDFEHQFIEQFNDVMAMLENKSRLLHEARERVEQSNRLASIGEFAAGLAHEINNPLDGIMSCTARLEREPENLAQNIEYLQMIREALNRLCRATQQLLEYSRKHELEREYFDIHVAIEHAAAFIGMSARQRSIDIKFDLDTSIPLIEGDRHALTQVFVNLLLNAVSAISEAWDGKNKDKTREEARRGLIVCRTRTLNMGGNNGACVEALITDDGPGISEAHMKRIFEPFFTTKEPGKGTGMGLTVVKRIIDEHGGTIRISSEEGRGTTVQLVLPTSRGCVKSSHSDDYTI